MTNKRLLTIIPVSLVTLLLIVSLGTPSEANHATAPTDLIVFSKDKASSQVIDAALKGGREFEMQVNVKNIPKFIDVLGTPTAVAFGGLDITVSYDPALIRVTSASRLTFDANGEDSIVSVTPVREPTLTERGRTLTPFDPTNAGLGAFPVVRFIDVDANTKYTIGDTLVLDADDSSTVTQGDTVVSATLTRAPTVDELGKQLFFRDKVKFDDADVDGLYDFGELLVFDNDGSDTISKPLAAPGIPAPTCHSWEGCLFDNTDGTPLEGRTITLLSRTCDGCPTVTAGSVRLAFVLLGPALPIPDTGLSGTLFAVQFRTQGTATASALGCTDINIVSSTLPSPTTGAIPHDIINGSFANDVCFTLSAPATAEVNAGMTVTIRVDVTLILGPTRTVVLGALGLPTGATASFDPPSGTPTFLSMMTISTLETTPTGDHVITITGKATGGGLVDGIPKTTTITLTVKPPLVVNRPPVLDPIGDKTVDEEMLLSFTATASDPDAGQTLTFSLGAGAPAGASITLGGMFTWTPTEAQGPNGYSVTIVVMDNGSPPASDSETIIITVREVNKAPVLGAIGSRVVAEETQLGFTATATDDDIPVQPLTFSLGPAPTGTFPAGATMTAAGAFTWTPTEAQGPGTYTAQLTVSDGTATDFEDITITVNEINKPPVLAVPGAQTVGVGSPLTFTVSATDPDIPVNMITLLAEGLPAGANFDPATGTFSWTPALDQAGMHTVTFRATDDGTPPLFDTEMVTITVVRPGADPKSVQAHSPTVIFATEPIMFDGTGSTDPDGTVASYLWEFDFNNDGIVDTTATTAVTTVTFPTDGTAKVTLTVTDNDGRTNSVSELMTVEPEPKFIRGKVGFTHHLRDTLTQVFSFKISNPSSVPVAVTITVKIFDEFGFEPAPPSPAQVTETFILAPNSLNTDARISWTPPNLPSGTSLGFTIEASISFTALAPGPDGMIGTGDDVILASGTNTVPRKGIIEKSFTVVSED